MGRAEDTRAVRVIRRLATSRLPFAQTAAEGALPALYAATDPRAEGGRFYGPGGFQHASGAPAEQKPYAPLTSVADAERLWSVSEQLTGVKWTP
jgi:hypothetical protein